jgi:hypothetical protein
MTSPTMQPAFDEPIRCEVYSSVVPRSIVGRGPAGRRRGGATAGRAPVS